MMVLRDLNLLSVDTNQDDNLILLLQENIQNGYFPSIIGRKFPKVYKRQSTRKKLVPEIYKLKFFIPKIHFTNNRVDFWVCQSIIFKELITSSIRFARITNKSEKRNPFNL